MPSGRTSSSPGAGRKEGRLVRLFPTRQAIARAMEQSRQIPTAVIRDFTIVDELVAFRRSLIEDSPSGCFVLIRRVIADICQ